MRLVLLFYSIYLHFTFFVIQLSAFCCC